MQVDIYLNDYTKEVLNAIEYFRNYRNEVLNTTGYTQVNTMFDLLSGETVQYITIDLDKNELKLCDDKNYYNNLEFFNKLKLVIPQAEAIRETKTKDYRSTKTYFIQTIILSRRL